MAKEKSLLNKIIEEVDKTLVNEIPDYEKKKKKVIDTIKGEKTDKVLKENVNTDNEEKPNMKKKKFCSNCGEELDEDDKFCDSCGTAVKKKNKSKKEKEEDNKVKTKKCPNCGASIKSFQTSCKYCQAEISNIKASNSLEEFSKGLASIKSKPMPKYEGKDSLLKKVIGRDFNDEDAKEEFENNFRRQKEEEIVNYIINYPIPNSNEDLTEFMILACSNINVKKDLSDEEQKAWIEKMEQIYQKAKISIKTGEEFRRINDLYTAKKTEIKEKKKNTAIKIVAGIIGWFALLGLIANPLLTIIIILLLASIGVFIYLKSHGKITFGMKEVKEVVNKVISFIKLIINKLKEFTNKVIEWYKKLNTKQRKKVNIGIILIIILLLAIVIIPNIITDSDSNNYNEKENTEINDKIEDDEGSINKEEIDYKTAEEFEKALNDGKKVKGKIVMFVVNEYKPDSSLGINCWAGEHLNFISEKELEVEKGNVVIGKITEEPTTILGSWKIEYEAIEIKKDSSITEDNANDSEKENTNDENNNETLEDDTENIVIMLVLAEEYIGENYKEVEKEMKNLGYTNIKIEKKKTNDTKNKDKTIKEFSINGKTDYERGTRFNKNDEIKIVYWELEKKESVSYSTNDYETAKKGNSGVYSYIKEGKFYDIYYIIDFDNGYVYYFNEGEGNDWCDKLKIKSGDLNSTLLFTYHDGGDTWDEALYFKYKNQPSILIVEDADHFQYEFKPTNLTNALKLRDNKKITSR